VESIRRWWDAAGSGEYPRARRLLVTADAGGSNGYRTRAWKAGLAALAAGTGLQITCCHFPPGTSKWNKVEHRLFSHITMNWRGRPLTSHDVIVNSIAATTTRTGLTVQARLDDGTYPTGVKVTSAQMAALPVSRHPFHGDWNYTLHLTAGPAAAPATRPAAGNEHSRCAPALPELTGLAPAEMDELIAQLAALRQAQREQRARSHPASDARHKPRSGRPPVFPFPDRVVATVLHLRLSLPDDTLAHLFGTSRTTMGRALTQTRHLLDQHGHRIEPVTAPPDLPARIPPHVHRTDGNLGNKVKEAC
jgi:DDE family transposase/DDE superfamily endonuclease